MLQPNIVLTREFIQFEDLLKTTFKDRLSFNAGETILSTADDRDKYCYYVMSGLVRCEFVGYTGSLRTTTMRGEGTIFPLYYTHKVTSMEKVLEFLAETPCSLIKIKKEDLRELMIEVPAMWLAMMDAWGEYATYLNYLVASQNDSARMKVCTTLYFSAKDSGVVEASHQQIAEVVGTSRETVSRILADLAKQGIIVQKKRLIHVLNLHELKNISSPIADIA